MEKLSLKLKKHIKKSYQIDSSKKQSIYIPF